MCINAQTERWQNLVITENAQLTADSWTVPTTAQNTKLIINHRDT